MYRIYKKTIEENQVGLKLIGGGTGIGKNYAWWKAIGNRFSLMKGCSPMLDFLERTKAIYFSNRKNLISEQMAKLRKEYPTIQLFHQKSTQDTILGLIKDRSIYEIAKLFDFDADSLKDIDNSINYIDSIKSNKNKYVQDDLRKRCGYLLYFFRDQFLDSKIKDKLKLNPLAWKIFPYMGFENCTKPSVLFMTIQKALHGFFDGDRKVNISNIENKIAAIDEFEFVEQDMLKILCEEDSISNQLEFIKMFIDSVPSWLKEDFWNEENNKALHKGLQNCLDSISKKEKQLKLNLAQIKGFRDARKTKQHLLFQSSKDCVTEPNFFLHQKDHYLIIDDKPTELPATIFFETLNSLTKTIVNSIADSEDCDDCVKYIWNPKNDNKAGEIAKYLGGNCSYKPKFKSKKDQDSIYDAGFQLVKLKKTDGIDKHYTELSQLELVCSPERIIADLCNKNLVFGLSATADMSRVVKSFDFEWLKANTPFIEWSNEDTAIVKLSRDEKAKKKPVQVNFRLAEELDSNHPLSKIVDLYKQTGFFSKEDDGDGTDELRANRALKVFNTFYKTVNSDSGTPHLAFVTSFEHAQKILDYKIQNRSSWFSSCAGTFESSRLYEDNDKYFNLMLDGMSCAVIFLSAEDIVNLQEDEYLEQYKKSFFDKEKVFVVTQYKSASNGVNLYAFDKKMDSVDWCGVALLEPNYFWFDKDENSRNLSRTNEKQAIWYWRKLWDSGQIDTEAFKSCLSLKGDKIDISKMNKYYLKEVPDRIVNAVALYLQTIGRGDLRNYDLAGAIRIAVTFDKDVFTDMYRFLSDERYQRLIEKRRDVTSDFVIKMQDEIMITAEEVGLKNDLIAQSYSKADKTAESILDSMLDEIDKVKAGKYDDKSANGVKDDWANIRKSVLRHEFNKKIFVNTLGRTIRIGKDFTMSTNLVVNGRLCIDYDNKKIYPGNYLQLNPQVKSFSLDYAYRVINKNSLLNKYFTEKGYKTVFDLQPNCDNIILVPHVYQRILLAAVGEEALRCILESHGFETEDLPNSLFEVADLKIKNKPVYFDSKNYNKKSLECHSPTIEETAAKYKILADHNASCILYVVNLWSDKVSRFFDKDFNEVQESDSCIRVIHAINGEYDISPVFDKSLRLLRNEIKTM